MKSKSILVAILSLLGIIVIIQTVWNSGVLQVFKDPSYLLPHYSVISMLVGIVALLLIITVFVLGILIFLRAIQIFLEVTSDGSLEV